MDKKLFTSSKTGDLYSFFNLLMDKNDLYFVPNAVPPQWEFPTRLWPLLSDAKGALERLDGTAIRLEDPNLLLRPLQNREAISSSSMEGTIVTPEQLLLYELDPRDPGSSEGKPADWKEVFNYGIALKEGCELLKDIPLSSRLIRNMHGTLMDGVRGQAKRPGEFRRSHAQIGHSAKYNAPQVPELDRLMSNLDLFMNHQGNEYDPLVLCYLIHYQFEAIHPFSDGNGRVGRALLAIMVYKLLEHSQPWLYMSPFFERYKSEYTTYLFNVSANGDWEEWIEFCLVGTIQQAKDAIRRCNRFESLRREYHDRDVSSTPRSHQLIDQLFMSPVVTVTSTSKQFGTTYHTARSDLERLMGVGILSEISGLKPRAFFARELMVAAFGDPEEDAD